MTLSGVSFGWFHVIIVETVLGLLEDALRSVVLSDGELVSIGAVECYLSCLRDPGQGEDICDPVRAEPNAICKA